MRCIRGSTACSFSSNFYGHSVSHHGPTILRRPPEVNAIIHIAIHLQSMPLSALPTPAGRARRPATRDLKPAAGRLGFLLITMAALLFSSLSVCLGHRDSITFANMLAEWSTLPRVTWLVFLANFVGVSPEQVRRRAQQSGGISWPPQRRTLAR